MLPYNKELKDEQRTKRQQSTNKPQNNHVPFLLQWYTLSKFHQACLYLEKWTHHTSYHLVMVGWVYLTSRQLIFPYPCDLQDLRYYVLKLTTCLHRWEVGFKERGEQVLMQRIKLEGFYLVKINNGTHQISIQIGKILELFARRILIGQLQLWSHRNFNSKWNISKHDGYTYRF